MRHLRIISTILFLAAMTTTAVAQIVSPVDFMRNNPRSVFANPATFTSDYGYFDLFLGGINLGFQNTGLKYDRFFEFNNSGQPTVLNLDQGVASLRDVNYLNSYLTYDIFHCGRRTNHGYFTYTHRLRYLETASYTDDLILLLAKGNASFLGESNPADINVNLSARLFQEFSVGYQMCLTDKLNIGMRMKLLMGYVDAKTNTLNAKVYTDPDTYALSITADADLQATIPYELRYANGSIGVVDSRFDVTNLFKNYGFGIDLGAEYQLTEQIGVAAAINDLGFIKWNNYSTKLTGGIQDGGSFYQNGAFVFSGLTSDQVSGMLDDPNYLSHLTDSLVDYFSITPESMTKYTTGLNTNMMVRGWFDVTPQHRLSAQFMGYNMGLGMKPAMTLAYSGSFSDKYDVVATYTMMNGSYDNIGIGLSANLGGLMLYVASSNVLGFFNPANISQLNLQFGISFTSGEKARRRECIVIGGDAYEEIGDDSPDYSNMSSN